MKALSKFWPVRDCDNLYVFASTVTRAEMSEIRRRYLIDDEREMR